MMKFRPFLLIAAALLISTTAIGCSPEPEESETPARKMTTAAQQESELKITRSEAANLAQAHIEAKLAQGNVLGRGKKCSKYGTVNYGDASCTYDEKNNSYTVKCKATCWGYDSYGNVVDKYKFDATVYINGKTGSASSGHFVLSKN